MPSAVCVTTVVERKHPMLPRFVVVPSAAVAPWKLTGTTVLEGTVNGIEMGRRTIKYWDERRWSIDLPEPLCRKAGIDVGDRAEFELRIAPEELPEELARLLRRSPAATAAWERLTTQRRMVSEQVAAASSSGSAPDGRYLMVRVATGDGAPRQLRVLLGWAERLARLAPRG